MLESTGCSENHEESAHLLQISDPNYQGVQVMCCGKPSLQRFHEVYFRVNSHFQSLLRSPCLSPPLTSYSYSRRPPPFFLSSCVNYALFVFLRLEDI